MSEGIVEGFAVASFFWFIICLFAINATENYAYKQAARDSLADNSTWKKALIDAEAERAKEAIK